MEWLALEDRFAFYGGGISFIGMPGEPPAPQASDPRTPVKGPFSADFRWVTLPDWPHGPIRLTDGQTKVFKSLWSLKGEPATAERIMQRAGLDSDKLVDVFKVKARDKHKADAAGAKHAYDTLVSKRRREG
ncbi:hypothetical protein OEZ76_26915, partial [Leclercia adecarboxylata]|nr:hypothetical protein [Leclercia adecarboxylata]